MRARGEADPPARYRTALVSPVLSVLVLLVLAARRPERRAGDMPSVYGQKYVWLVEDAEGQSHDREGTSDARRVMFRESIETEHGEKKAGDHLTWGEVIDLWIDDRDFRAAWMASFEDFRDVNWGTGDYYWECAPVKSASLGARYEHVVKDKGARWGGAADEGAFAEHFDAARNAGMTARSPSSPAIHAGVRTASRSAATMARRSASPSPSTAATGRRWDM